MGNNQTNTNIRSTNEATTLEALLKDVEYANKLIETHIGVPIFEVWPTSEEDIPILSLWKMFVQIEVIEVGNRGLIDISKISKLNVKQFYQVYDTIKMLIPSNSITSTPTPTPSPQAERFIQNMLASFDNECAICMDKKAEMVLECTHAFCEKCIQGWQRKSNTCPMCRCKIQKNNDDDWVLTGSGPEGQEVTTYLTQCLHQYSR